MLCSGHDMSLSELVIHPSVVARLRHRFAWLVKIIGNNLGVAGQTRHLAIDGVIL